MSFCGVANGVNERRMYTSQIREDLMRSFWTRDFLTRRIDRCYLVAAWAKAAERRRVHLELARYYRRLLAGMSASLPQAA